MEITEILSLAIVGGVASLFIEYITKNLSSIKSKIATIIACFIIGTLYMWLMKTGLLASVTGVLVSASTIYAFFIKK